jgi:dihydropyrimidinase
MQMLIKNGLCINADGRFQADIAISKGRIVELGQNLHAEANCPVVDASGALVLPGIIDAHVHLPWPSASFDSTDNFQFGTTAAVCGGVTTVIEYVVPELGDQLIPSLETHMKEAQGSSFSDYSFHMILRKITSNSFGQMAEVMKRGISSFKIYTAYDGFQLNDEEILTALRASVKLGAIICFHAESGHLVSDSTKQLVEEGKTDIHFYPEAHPIEADTEATQRIIFFARFTGARIHIAHVNTRFGARLIAKARRSKLAITGETCPHYLIFTDDVYKSGRPESAYYVLAPAIRGPEEREGLWVALAENDLQMVATDHCPYTSKQKLQGTKDFRLVPGGASGIETSLSLLYTYGVRRGRLSLERLVETMSTNPARIFNLYPQKGTIAVGSQADLIIFDETGRTNIEAGKLHSRTDHSIYEGMEVLGRARMTILRGEVIVKDGMINVDQPTGQFIRRPSYQQKKPE